MKKGKVKLLFKLEEGTYLRQNIAILNVIEDGTDTIPKYYINMESSSYIEKDGDTIYDENNTSENDYKTYFYKSIDEILSFYKYTPVDTVTWLEQLVEVS